jgi:hypothetical protein
MSRRGAPAQPSPPFDAGEIDGWRISRRRPLANPPIPQPLMRPLRVVVFDLIRPSIRFSNELMSGPSILVIAVARASRRADSAKAQEHGCGAKREN